MGSELGGQEDSDSILFKRRGKEEVFSAESCRKIGIHVISHN